MAELLLQRARDAKHHDLGNGLRAAVFAPHTHYQDDNGDWQDVALDFEPQGAGVWRMNKHVLGAELAANEISILRRANGKGIKFPLPPGFTVEGRTITFTFDGLTWRFTLTKTGSKLEATVPARRGAQSYQFTYARLAGANALSLDAAGSLVSDEFVMPRPYAISANGTRYEGSWSVNPARVTLSFDDTQIPDAEFPYVLDPTTTFNVAASGDDGHAESTDTTYPPSAGQEAFSSDTVCLVAKYLNGPDYLIAVGLVRWDTSSLPDNAAVDSATFRSYVTAKDPWDGRSLTAEWYDAGTIGTEDYTTTVGTNAHAGTTIASITDDADNDFALTNVANVSKTGYTGLRLHISGGEPTGVNFVQFAAFDHATLVEPRLLVTYTEAGTTFNVAASDDDGHTSGDDSTYPPPAGEVVSSTGTTLAVQKGTDAVTFFINVGLIRWDTSSLPDDATVDSATLRLRAVLKDEVDGRSLTAEWYDAGTIGTEDYTSTVGTDAHAGTTLASITTGADNDFALTNVSNVSKTGYTGLRLHVSGGQPTGENFISFAAFDHATLTEPRLIVNYTEDEEESSPATIMFVARRG